MEPQNTTKLYNVALSYLGRDASPHDYAPNELGYAESVSNLIQDTFPDIRFPTLLSTRDLYTYLMHPTLFLKIDEPESGCIIISVTGTGNGKISNGHTGIVGQHVSPDGSPWIMSNDSRTGLWSANFTLAAWKKYYTDRGGMSVNFFRVL